MLTSEPAGSRSIRSMRQFLSSFQQNSLPETFAQDETMTKPLKILHLPPSIQTNEQISNELWAWIHLQDVASMRQEILDRIPFRNELTLRAAQSTRLLLYHGEPVAVPPHLLVADKPQELKASKPTKNPGKPPAFSKKSNRKSVNETMKHIPNPVKPMKRIFIQVSDICMKHVSNVESIVCLVKVGYQQQCSVQHLLIRESNKMYLMHPMEGFLFDARDDDFRVTISLHSCFLDSNRLQGLSRKPSFLFFNLSKKEVLKSVPLQHESHSNHGIPSQSAIGPLLGELTFTLNPQKNLKSMATFTFMNGKKEVAKVNLSMGYIQEKDERLKTVKKPKEEIPEYKDFLNVMICSNNTWRKYWMSFQDECLNAYDFEYKDTKSMLGTIPTMYLKSVQEPEPEYLCIPHSIKLELSSKARDDEWVQGVTAESFDFNDSDSVVMYVAADSKDSQLKWLKTLKAAVDQDVSQMALPKPPLPPRLGTMDD